MTGKNISIGVIDGQGGGIGSEIIRRLREEVSLELDIVALGTNAMATAAMMKAQANRGASGENAILYSVNSLHIIVGSWAIITANSMMGEISPRIAAAVAGSRAQKLLLPLKMEGYQLMGYVSQPFPHLIGELIAKIKKILESA